MPVFRYRWSSRPGPLTVEDYRERARRAVPDMVWAYVDYGAESMTTLNANRAAFDRYMLKSKVLTGREAKDLGTTIAGQDISAPILLAPTGAAGLSHWTGELGAAQGAEAAGTLSIVSTAASYSFEEIAAGTRRGHFFQLYPWADTTTGRHDLTHAMMKRAANAGYTGMFVTVDVPTHGNRESEQKRGMGNPPVLTPARVLNAGLRPKWWAAFLRHERMSLRNLVDPGEKAGGAKTAMKTLNRQFRMMRPELNWDDFAWMRENWHGPLYIKGVLDAADAVRAVELGADGIVVSNHGGRQLDCAPAAIDALPAIAAGVGDRAEVLVDGGIRRGTDIIKALCLGADGVCIGRPYLYGLAAGGPDGARHVVEILKTEMRRAMTLMGVAELAELDESWLIPAGAPVPVVDR
ncbi:alpha-hydroxy-acid oxidizing protein [Nocardia sp. NBC_01377]|uniref:alpha-hydroxy acid oxidase n=1 Tax=Nocardia sp. NBC_01377 TaxID=2903595 RepID=UPI0032471371